MDRGKGDPRSILAVVMSMEDGCYKLGSKHGVIKGSFVRSQFDICTEKLIDMECVPDTEKGVRELATAHSVTGGQGFIRCACTQKCVNNRCKCRSKGLLCNSPCHNSLNCCNKETDINEI